MTGRGRGKALTRPAWMDEPRLVPSPSLSHPQSSSAAILDWARATAADGRPYWYSLATGATTWTDPAAATASASRSPDRGPTVGAHVWREHTTEDGRTYYYNEVSKQTQWERPSGYEHSSTASAVPSAERDGRGSVVTPNGGTKPERVAAAMKPTLDGEKKLPTGWAEHRTGDGRLYYYHSATRETRWEFPITGSSFGTESAADLIPKAKKRHADEISDGRDTTSAVVGAVTMASTMQSSSQWKEHTTPEGKTYYYNMVTRETSWVKPREAGAGDDSAGTNRKRPRVGAEVSDLRQLVSRSSSLKVADRKASQSHQVVRRPRASDGKALTDHQAEKYFLNRTRIRREGNDTGSERKGPSATGGTTLRQREMRFFDMLREHGVSWKTSWLETMSRCAGDERYSSLQPYGFRKDVWLKFRQKAIKQHRRLSIVGSRSKADSFLSLLNEAFVNEPYTASSLDRCNPEAVKKFEADRRFRVIDERTRAGLIKSFFGIRARQGERERAQKRKDCLARMQSELERMVDPTVLPGAGLGEGMKKTNEVNDFDGEKMATEGQSAAVVGDESAGGKVFFSDRTPFRELEKFLLKVPGSDFVDSSDRAGIIRDWRRSVERLTQEKKARERENRKALQRERRASFRSGVENMLLEGRIPISARWKDVSEIVVKESFAVPEADLDARPSDLFEDALELFDDRVQRNREEFKRLLKEGDVDVQDSTTVDDLMKVNGLHTFINGLERPVVAALLADRQRREGKRRQKELHRATSEFEELIRRRDLRAETTFESLVELLKDRSAYKQLHNLAGDNGVRKVYDDFMEWWRTKEQTRLKRKFETRAAPYDPVALAALERAKRVRLPGTQTQPGPFRVPPPLASPPVEAENGWAAALSSKPMTEKEKLEEKERRKREILEGLSGQVIENTKPSSQGAE